MKHLYTGREGRREKHEQRWAEEEQSKKTLDLYAAVKHELKEEKYVEDPGDRRGRSSNFDSEQDKPT